CVYRKPKKQPVHMVWTGCWHLTDLFFHGHAPGKNTVTREQPRKAAAKPHRSAELFWDAKTKEVFSHPVIRKYLNTSCG
ncbi:MAG: hypothetical protein IKU27_07670, partial [Clostridia bacterium]|nr:hypothetical protein [Clostridia bacterium]